jgi:hypothetical protein
LLVIGPPNATLHSLLNRRWILKIDNGEDVESKLPELEHMYTRIVAELKGVFETRIEPGKP